MEDDAYPSGCVFIAILLLGLSTCSNCGKIDKLEQKIDRLEYRMIEFRQGDIFESGAEALVNPVNCVGVMGKGLALEFKRRFPDNFTIYKSCCATGNMKIGEVLVYELSGLFPLPLYIVNFPTKNHWRNRSELSFIMQGLRDLRCQVSSLVISSIAIPALGCGLGGLKWGHVKAVMISELAGLDCNIMVYEPRE